MEFPVTADQVRQTVTDYGITHLPHHEPGAIMTVAGEITDERLAEIASAANHLTAHSPHPRITVAEAAKLVTELQHRREAEAGTPEADDTDRMWKISKLIAELQATHAKFGDTCVYIRRGGLSWGAVALNRQSDDKERGVFDLQATHDRAMEERLGQVNRLIAERNDWRDRATKAEASLSALGEHP